MRLFPPLVAIAACGPSPTTPPPDPPDACATRCSDDFRAVLCGDAVQEACSDITACDPGTVTCLNACAAAEQKQSSIGCNYFATSMDVFRHGNCFAAFVANTWPAPAHIAVRRAGVELPVAAFARIPVGTGASLTFEPYDAAAGLPPGQVAVLFLGGAQGANPKCPVASAAEVSSFSGNGIGDSFEVVTDVPTVAYQINPFGGGSTAVYTGATLLLPTSVWHTSYVAVSGGVGTPATTDQNPSFNIVAREDGTIVTIDPPSTLAVTGGNGIPASAAAGVPIEIALDRGQHAQITQETELTGSLVTANKPVGVMAGHQCMDLPAGETFCDHVEQQLPPVRALGSRYAGVMYRPRVAAETTTFWRVVGTVDNTLLAYSTNVGGPITIDRGEAITFETGTPFVVTSQDAEHPFMLFAYMSSSGVYQNPVDGVLGDPDFVLGVPPEQWLDRYVFFTDPTYPETNLVVVRTRGTDALFHDVSLDCAGVLAGWEAITPDLEFTRVDLSTGNFMNAGACGNGRHEMSSDAPFGLTVWAWGSSKTTPDTKNVSYGYPGGMNVQPINNVIF